MSEHLQSPEERAAAALAEYKSNGPEVPVPGIEPEKMKGWIEQCEGAKLAPAQLLDLAWLKMEYATATAQEDLPGARGAFLEVEKHLRKAIKDPKVDRYTRAKSFWAVGSLPLIQAMSWINHVETLSGPLGPKYKELQGLYKKSLDMAASEAHLLLGEREPTANETVLCQTLAVCFLVNSSITGRFTAIPVPPRCFEDTISDQASSALVWDAHGKVAALRLTETEQPGYLTFPGLITPGEASPPDEFRLYNNVFRSAAGKKSTFLQKEALLADYEKIDKATQKFFNETPTQSQPPETNNPSEPSITIDQLTPPMLPEWYENLTQGRPLNYAESLQLDKLLIIHDLKKLPLTPEQNIALRYLRLDCALAMAGNNPDAAAAQLANFQLNTPPILPELQQRGEITALYEASINLAITPLYQALISGRKPAAETIASMGTDISELLSEMLWEKNRSERTKEEKEALGMLLSPVFNALFLTIVSEGNHLYLPALPRQRHIDSGGWHINAWRAENEGYIPEEMRKIRLVPTGRLRHEQDVACVPLSLMGQRNNPELLIAAFAAELNHEATPKSAAYLKRHGTKIIDLLSAAWHTATR